MQKEIEINKLYFENCIEILKRLPDNCIDFFCEDPPFNSTDCNFEYELNLQEYWNERKRVAKKTATFAIKCQMPFTFKVGMSNLDWFRHRWIWEKDKCANFFIAGSAPLKKTEDILIFSERGHYKVWNSKIDAPTYNPQKTINPNKPRISNGNHNTKDAFSTSKIRSGRQKGTDLITKEENIGYNFPTEILYYPVPFADERIHPTQTPIELMEFLIKTYTNEGDLIFDGYSGSGSVPHAAIRLNRNWIGCENSIDYFADTEKRIAETYEIKELGYAKTKLNSSNQFSLF